jgi:hypothetical protein
MKPQCNGGNGAVMIAHQKRLIAKLRSCPEKFLLCIFAHIVIDNQCVIRKLHFRNCALFAHFCAMEFTYMLLGQNLTTAVNC